MGQLNVDFKFHNVGQGLFYTGRLRYGNASFNFVYDCGSKRMSLARDAINQEFRPDENIDLLIVSHLHKDHTSGIPYLFKRTSVDTVLLPYLSPLERLIVALTTSRASREYYSFLVDPVTYFLERNVRRVVLIGGEEADRRENWIPPFERPPDLPPEGRFELINELSPSEELAKHIGDIEPELVHLIKDGRVEVRNHSGDRKHQGVLKVSLHTIPLWIFRVFNYKVSPRALSQFGTCVKRTLGGIDSRRIKSAIADSSQRKALKSCYDKLAGGTCYLNNTSLIIVHQPAFRLHRIVCRCDCPSCPCCCRPWRDCWYCCLPIEMSLPGTSNFVQFLTGDIDLNTKFNEISQHFGLGRVVTNTVATLVPHHGSRYNWNRELCRAIESNFWIVSAGIRNRYGHPSPQVLHDICINCQDHCVVWVNEATYFRLMGFLEF